MPANTEGGFPTKGHEGKKIFLDFFLVPLRVPSWEVLFRMVCSL
jgi:hypothetical protein